MQRGTNTQTDRQTDTQMAMTNTHFASAMPHAKCNNACNRLVEGGSTRRPASADRTVRRQFQATGQPVSRMQATDAMTSRLPRYEAKCVQRRCFQWGSVPLRSDIKGTELPPANILIPLERQWIALQLCCWQFLHNETLQQTFRPLLSKLSKIWQIQVIYPHFKEIRGGVEPWLMAHWTAVSSSC